MVKPSILRTRSITVKLTEAEYAQMEEKAGLAGLNLSEWTRGRLMRDEQPDTATGGVVLAEVLALRMILMNQMFSVSRGEAMTPEKMQALIERADRDKMRRARERLEAVRRETAEG
jgi:hypothetical protein